MSHPSSRVEVIDGLRVEAKAFKTNLFFYKSIGGQVEVRGVTRRRRWWCLWLCRTRNSANADRIRIENTYFSRLEGTPFGVAAAGHETECRATSDCTLKHWAFGIGVKLEFPDGDASPTTVADLMPLDGVISRAGVVVGGGTPSFETAKGTHPG